MCKGDVSGETCHLGGGGGGGGGSDGKCVTHVSFYGMMIYSKFLCIATAQSWTISPWRRLSVHVFVVIVVVVVVVVAAVNTWFRLHPMNRSYIQGSVNVCNILMKLP